MNVLVDTHCHLCHGKLRQQTAELLQHAADAGVTRVVCAAADVTESTAAAALAAAFPGVVCLAGIHPHDASDATPEALATIESLAGHPKNVAIGEIGLDYHYDYSPRDRQREAFSAQLDMAARLQKNVVIHTREAFDDTLAILTDSALPGERIVFHSFTGDDSQCRRALDIGAAVSFSGIVTFKTADDIRTAAALVPDDRILIETDAPFLSPEPVRKMKINEPANVAHVAARLARIRNTPLERFAEQTTRNAERFFRL